MWSYTARPYLIFILFLNASLFVQLNIPLDFSKKTQNYCKYYEIKFNNIK